MRTDEIPQTSFKVEAPTSCAVFPCEILKPPRSWAERVHIRQRWAELPRRGHFAAMEEPGLYVDDVRPFFRQLR